MTKVNAVRSSGVWKMTPAEKSKLDGMLKAGGQSPVWKPKAGETLYLKISELRKIETKKGKKLIKSVLVTGHKFTGEQISFWQSTVIESKFKELGIKLGDRIAVQFKGKKKNYNDYAVAKL